MKTERITLTCKLTSPELQKRRATVIRALKDLLLNKEGIAEGLRFTFPNHDEVLDKLIAFIKSERLCCEFFTFRLLIREQPF